MCEIEIYRSKPIRDWIFEVSLSLYVTENPGELEDCCREYWKPDNHDETLGEISKQRFSVSENLFANIRRPYLKLTKVTKGIWLFNFDQTNNFVRPKSI